MATNFSANQYDGAFKSHKLQNWTVPKAFKERPKAAEGPTTFIATDRGHLLPSAKTRPGSARPSFRGTWDLQQKVSSVNINPTGRSREGLKRLRKWSGLRSAPAQDQETSNVEKEAEKTRDPEQKELDTERPGTCQSCSQSKPVNPEDQDTS